MSRLAIIGAGVSGLATAWALRASSIDVTVFEKSRGYSGRAATRRRENLCYDHGANYFKTHSPEIEQLVHEQLPSGDLVAIDRDVWTFDADGTLHGGDASANADAKWTYRRGINTIGKLLAAAADADVRLRTRIERVEAHDDGWKLFDIEETALGAYDAVVFTPPAPQTRALLQASVMDDGLRDTLLDGLADATYASQFTIVLGFDRTIPRPGNFYALLNTDRAHPMAWLSFEEDKPGHVPDGQSVVILQMAPDWTETHFDADRQTLATKAAAHAEQLLGATCSDPAWYDHQRWRYALPTASADRDALRKAEPSGLFVTGDALVGKGRVHRALETGLRCAERVRRQLA